MSKVFVAVFVIFGTVVGSGFSSGKEIFVFFSRFGVISYPLILLSGAMFFWIFRFLLQKGATLVQRAEMSLFFSAVTTFVSFVFCASMFAGISSLFSHFSVLLKVFLLVFVRFLCFVVALKGMKSLESLNLFLMPLTALVFFGVLVFAPSSSSFGKLPENNFLGVFYAPLYVALNTSMSMIVLANVGKKMTKRQSFCACLLSTFLIVGFLLLGNRVLETNPQISEFEMPFLAIAGENKLVFSLMFFVILAGCFSTLISLCFTLNCALSKFVNVPFLSACASVVLPFAFSLIGFSEIVTLLYPLCSVLSIFSVLFLFFQRREVIFLGRNNVFPKD